ncbi:beta-lactamase hydrolase domain-containing protein [Citromicrobium sp. JLT1363]|jgi:uncharacterized protein (TIGR01244 family)|uniref:beta-lactamase hydrolase domain-containing protein n=1 Tax=Citromicrobium sp. JLT1363 TaxID=517722 RepID=UPI000225E06F|nr:sulfur transferase domain-containing protein [Citromicrobium sp. JLT1363]
MVDMVQLEEGVCATGQLSAAQMSEVADKGFKSVIGNRPDGEEPGQPEWSVLEDAARSAGLETRFIPVASAEDLAAQSGAFAQALEALPRPILAFCRSGARTARLYEAAKSG